MHEVNREFLRDVTPPVLPTMRGVINMEARLARYTAISEIRAAWNVHVHCLDYRCESAFRWRDKLSESAVYTMSMTSTSSLMHDKYKILFAAHQDGAIVTVARCR